MKKILIVYKSVTGFTKEYAEMIAHEVEADLLDLKSASASTLSAYDIIVFGGRVWAGTVDGLKQAKKLFQDSKASTFLVFASGATSNSEQDIIDAMWKNNFSSDELLQIPHFYMQGGLRYERTPKTERLIMKVVRFMLKKKKDKSDYETEFEKSITSSFDNTSASYIQPLIEQLHKECQ